MKRIRPVITPQRKDPSPFMNLRILCSVVLLGLLTAVWPSAATRYMSADEMRPGMVGVGRTVFDGDRVEEFKVHLLGVLRNTTGPRRDLILARLEGGPLAHTGVIAGMSGSPVYVDGRLLGAVSFSLGQFSKEPIAGITPIAEMIETADPSVPRGPAVKTQDLAAGHARIDGGCPAAGVRALRAALWRGRAECTCCRAAATPGPTWACCSARLRPRWSSAASGSRPRDGRRRLS